MTAIALYYDEEKNPGGFAPVGVPLRDLTDDDLAEMPKHIKASAEAAPFFRKTKPAAKTKADAPAADATQKAEAK